MPKTNKNMPKIYKNMPKKKPDKEPKVWIQVQNELLQQENFLAYAEYVLEKEILCLQVDEMKLKSMLRQATIKKENTEDDDDFKEFPEVKLEFDGITNELNSNFKPVDLPESFSIQIKEEPLDDETLQHMNTLQHVNAEEKSANSNVVTQSRKRKYDSSSDMLSCQLKDEPPS